MGIVKSQISVTGQNAHSFISCHITRQWGWVGQVGNWGVSAHGGGRGMSLFCVVIQGPRRLYFELIPFLSPDSSPFNWQVKRTWGCHVGNCYGSGLEETCNTWNVSRGLEVLQVIIRKAGKCGPAGCPGRRQDHGCWWWAEFGCLDQAFGSKCSTNYSRELAGDLMK